MYFLRCNIPILLPYIIIFCAEIGVSATITLPVPQNAESQRCRLKDAESIPTEENIDNEEDENVGCLNEEVEKYFSSVNHENTPDTSGHSNR